MKYKSVNQKLTLDFSTILGVLTIINVTFYAHWPKMQFLFLFFLLLFQLLIISQSSTSRALSWIQSKLGKQYL